MCVSLVTFGQVQSQEAREGHHGDAGVEVGRGVTEEVVYVCREGGGAGGFIENDIRAEQVSAGSRPGNRFSPVAVVMVLVTVGSTAL